MNLREGETSGCCQASNACRHCADFPHMALCQSEPVTQLPLSLQTRSAPPFQPGNLIGGGVWVWVVTRLTMPFCALAPSGWSWMQLSRCGPGSLEPAAPLRFGFFRCSEAHVFAAGQDTGLAQRTGPETDSFKENGAQPHCITAVVFPVLPPSIHAVLPAGSLCTFGSSPAPDWQRPSFKAALLTFPSQSWPLGPLTPGPVHRLGPVYH